MNITATTEGDLGDAIMTAGVLANLPGEHKLLIRRSNVTKWRTDEAVATAVKLLAPLFATIPSITEFRAAQPDEKADWDSAGFRPRHYKPWQTLFTSHASHLKDTLKLDFDVTFKPWLKVKPNERFWNKFIVNRSARYRNDLFPWHRFVESYGYKIVFVGMEQEYQEFCNAFGRVAYHPTETLLDVAEAIAGCERFIGNQSSAHCIAAALGNPLLLEVSMTSPDVCFGGKDALYCYDGSVPYFSLPAPEHAQPQIPKGVVPPGGWQYPGFCRSTTFNSLAGMMARSGILNAEKLLMRENVLRLSESHGSFFKSKSFALVERALDDFSCISSEAYQNRAV